MNKKVFRRLRNPKLEFALKFDDGYEYCCYQTKGNTRYIKCSEHFAQSCPAHGKILNGKPHLSIGHTHEKNLKLKQDSEFQESLHNATIARPFQSLRLIYDTLCLKHCEAAVTFTWAKMKPVMENWRRRIKPSQPPIPKDLIQFTNYLLMPEWAHLISYPKGQLTVVTLETPAKNLLTVLYDSTFLQSITGVTELFMDATFRITPRKPKVYQVFTILGVITNGQILPLIWVVELEKNEESCETILRKISSLKGTLAPMEIYTDFDDDYWKAINSVFPGTIINGTFLTHCKIIINAAKSFNLDPKDDATLEVISRILSISLLPDSLIVDTLRAIVRDLNDEEFQRLHELFDYYNNSWLSNIKVENYSFHKNLCCLWKNPELILQSLENRLQRKRDIWNLIGSYLVIF